MQRLYTKMLARLVSDERGQGTVEYVLVMVAVATIAVVLITWAKSGSGKSGLSQLFDRAIDIALSFIRR